MCECTEREINVIFTYLCLKIWHLLQPILGAIFGKGSLDWKNIYIYMTEIITNNDNNKYNNKNKDINNKIIIGIIIVITILMKINMWSYILI